jgi:hypothetical protein
MRAHVAIVIIFKGAFAVECQEWQALEIMLVRIFDVQTDGELNVNREKAGARIKEAQGLKEIEGLIRWEVGISERRV